MKVRRERRRGAGSGKGADKAKQADRKAIKVCFGPCRCFSAAKR